MMAKLSWNAFVAKYPGTGHLVSTGTQPRRFKKPSGISPKNQKLWPTIPALLKEAIGSNLTGDWAHMAQKVPGSAFKNGKRVNVAAATLHLFAFTQPQDASIAATFLRASSSTPAKSPQAGFASYIRGSEIDMQEYARLVKILGY
jgi:hypothetical protein